MITFNASTYKGTPGLMFKYETAFLKFFYKKWLK